MEAVGFAGDNLVSALLREISGENCSSSRLQHNTDGFMAWKTSKTFIPFCGYGCTEQFGMVSSYLVYLGKTPNLTLAIVTR
jgi:hypothetical protein